MSEKLPIGEEIKKIQQQEIEDLNRLVDEVVAPAAPPDPPGEPKTPPVAQPAPPAGELKTPFPGVNPDNLPDTGRQRYAYRQGDEFAATSKNWKETEKAGRDEKIAPKKNLSVEAGPEDIQQAELNQVINDFWAKRSQIEEMKAKKTKWYASLANTLGIKTRSLDNDEEVINLEKESEDIRKILAAKGLKLYANDKVRLKEFVDQYVNTLKLAPELINRELDKRAELAGLPENVFARFHKIGDTLSKMKWWQRSLVMGGLGLTATGAIVFVGAGTVGATVLGLGTRFGLRGIGAALAGIGKKIHLQKELKKERDVKGEKETMGIMDFLSQYEHDLDAGIEMVINNGRNLAEMRRNYEEASLQNTRQALKFAGKTAAYSTAFGETFRAIGQETGINVASIFRKIGEHTGISLGGAKQSVEHFLGIDNVSAKHVAVGGGITQQTVEHLQPSGGAQQNLSPESYAQVEKAIASYEPEHNMSMDDIVAKEAAKMQAAGLGIEPETKSGGSLQDWAKSMPAAGAEVQAPEVPKPQFEEISAVKIKAGGTMWGSIENNIKANPEAYGLDPKSPGFKADMHKMTQQLLDEFAYRKGLSYEQLDQIARTKIRAGDSFKIIYNPSTEEISLDDFHGKAFGPDVSQAAPAEEIVSGKAAAVSPEPEEVKLKAGATAAEEVPKRPGAGTAVAEHQPARPRGAGKMKYSPEIEEMDRVAKENWAKATDYTDRVAKWKTEVGKLNEKDMAFVNQKNFLAARGALNRIIEGAGIGSRANFWETHAPDWYNRIMGAEDYIAQDVSQADQVNGANSNLLRLKVLFNVFGKPEGGTSMSDYLAKILSNPVNAGRVKIITSGNLDEILRMSRK